MRGRTVLDCVCLRPLGRGLLLRTTPDSPVWFWELSQAGSQRALEASITLVSLTKYGFRHKDADHGADGPADREEHPVEHGSGLLKLLEEAEA